MNDTLASSTIGTTTASSLVAQLIHEFADLVFEPNKPIAPLTYFKVGGPAEVFVSLTTKNDLIRVVTFCQKRAIKFTIIGGASNIIVSDNGISGLVIQNLYEEVGISHQAEKSGAAGDAVGPQAVLQAGTGIKMAALVAKTTQLGLTGLEYFLGVPGSLGGAVYNNSHYLLELIGDHITRVEVIGPNGEISWINQQDCEFGYDSSRFQKTKEVIINVEFALLQGDPEVSRQKIAKAVQYRAQTQPLGPPSSGCIFQNQPNTPQLQALFPDFADKKFVPSGYIIDQAGLKGLKIGGVEVSQKHAAWFINDGSGTAADALSLISEVKARVKSKFGLDLKEEVFWVS